MRRSRARSVVAVATSALLLAGLGCGGPGPGEAAADLEGEAAGLRFEGLAPVPAREVAPLETFGARDGSELPVRHYPAEAGTTLLLIHGSGYHSTYLAPLASRLAARGDIDYVDQLEDDLADLAAHARERHPGTRIVVGGHSSGGGLVVRFAGGRHGQLAAAYLLLAPYLGHDAPTLRPKAGGWARPRIPVIIALSILNGFGVTGLNGITAITFEMPEEVRDGTETLAYSFRLNTGYAPRDYRKDLAGVQVPVLGLIGAGDEAFFAEKLEPTLSEISNARVAVIPGITHLDLPAAAETEEQVAAWLAAL
jgi:pimeloyl-ACP methyl ester carboxylesterase